MRRSIEQVRRDVELRRSNPNKLEAACGYDSDTGALLAEIERLNQENANLRRYMQKVAAERAVKSAVSGVKSHVRRDRDSI